MDMMTRIVTHPTIRRLVSRLSLPIRLPTLVRRSGEPDGQRPLLGKRVVLAGLAGDSKFLADAGAHVVTLDDTEQADAMVLDVAFLGGPKALYKVLHPRLKLLAAHCRVLLVTTAEATDADRDAVVGFAKSFAREVGQRAITVNVIEMAKGAHAASTLVWFASDRSRYITAQRIILDGRGKNGTLSLAGETAIVTGAARGIGAAISQILARQGASVTLIDLPQTEQAAQQVIAAIRKIGGSAKFVAGDITSDNVIGSEKASLLVNNAGITADKTFARMTEAQWNKVIGVNYEAAVQTTEHWLAAGNTGRVVFISSVVGISGNFGQTNYTLSKAALIGYARSLRRDGVRANAIAPGFIDTVLTREVPLLNREVGKQLTCLLQAGEPEDIAEAVAFLGSAASSAISGQTLRVDGGMFFGA